MALSIKRRSLRTSSIMSFVKNLSEGSYRIYSSYLPSKILIDLLPSITVIFPEG